MPVGPASLLPLNPVQPDSHRVYPKVAGEPVFGEPYLRFAKPRLADPKPAALAPKPKQEDALDESLQALLRPKETREAFSAVPKEPAVSLNLSKLNGAESKFLGGIFDLKA